MNPIARIATFLRTLLSRVLKRKPSHRSLLHPVASVGIDHERDTAQRVTVFDTKGGRRNFDPRDLTIESIPDSGLFAVFHRGRFVGVVAAAPDLREPHLELDMKFERQWRQARAA